MAGREDRIRQAFEDWHEHGVAIEDAAFRYGVTPEEVFAEFERQRPDEARRVSSTVTRAILFAALLAPFSSLWREVRWRVSSLLGISGD